MHLPDLAKGAGEVARHQAAWAVGSTLFWRGRFADALKWLPDSPEGKVYRGWTLALLGEPEAALALPVNAALHYFLDQPVACLGCLEAAADALAAAQRELLRYWARSRLGQAADAAAAQRALAVLRRLAPCDEARGMAAYALAIFHQNPGYALPHLDHALDLFARFGLHHLEARLLEHKARALAAAGLLRDAGRFEQVAAEAKRRQVAVNG